MPYHTTTSKKHQSTRHDDPIRLMSNTITDHGLARAGLSKRTALALVDEVPPPTTKVWPSRAKVGQFIMCPPHWAHSKRMAAQRPRGRWPAQWPLQGIHNPINYKASTMHPKRSGNQEASEQRASSNHRRHENGSKGRHKTPTTATTTAIARQFPAMRRLMECWS